MATKRKDSRNRNLRDGETQEKSGVYRYQYIDKSGKRHTIRSWRLVESDATPAGKRDCLPLREMEKQIEADQRDGIDSRTAAALTVNDLFEKYMKSKPELKASTANNYRYMYTRFVFDSFGLRKIASVRYSDVKSFYNSLIESGLKIASLAVIHEIMHPMFKLAVKDGYIRVNPTDGAMGEIRKLYKGKPERRHALTIAEQTAFFNFISASDVYRHWKPIFTVLLGTGTRIGECLALQWDDCDFKNGTISISKQLTYKPINGKMEMHVTNPKSAAAYRTIPMLNEVRAALIQERQNQFQNGGCKSEIDGYSNFVFTNRFGRVHCPKTINDTIKRVYEAYNEQERQAAGQEHREPELIRHFSVHSLRHTFITRCCEAEMNIKTLQSIAGHESSQTTLDVYAECTAEKKKETFESLQGKIKIS